MGKEFYVLRMEFSREEVIDFLKWKEKRTQVAPFVFVEREENSSFIEELYQKFEHMLLTYPSTLDRVAKAIGEKGKGKKKKGTK